MSWALSDLIRFLYYFANGKSLFLLKWIRYSAFILLYPLGFGCEMYSMWKAKEIFMKFKPLLNGPLSFLSNPKLLYFITLPLEIPGISLYHI